ncbi:Serine/threonine protein kinase, Pkn2 family protein [Fulvimarina pelagi HTCC2506]|uniref:Serine/threonine protein kinase, Pkn2 family protein n=1 Tax=Fulvimarina pelagi HTCC2506 TaxID=314231 RepID=Q0G5D3_9HYPH|nr:protein kinase [Fulvimarina pelagi]EAU43131.1 Serine/threonine protein kinase, Pkn2 family protein [Fulvimarina pelagi HTCC2506]
MDSARAKILEEQILGTSVGEWTIESLIDHGKSAAVFKAKNENTLAAVKIFDRELIERFGDGTQLARINRELSLKGRGHSNMVEILDGGFDPAAKHHFLVMAYLEGANLKRRLPEIPVEAIGGYISDLADCAEYLESLDLVHRDIKPENILVSDDLKKVTLLDFGVIKPFNEPGVTDVEGLQPFIGTLQYSSPEFLLRQEDGTTEGWRALTFYQLGGVLHDLIMRKALFSEYSDPFAKLVNAVQDVVPTIQSNSVPTYLVDLARMCLLKKPEDRLKLLTWDSFRPPKSAANGLAGIKERVTKRALAQQAAAPSGAGPKPDFVEPLVAEIVAFIKAAVRRISAENAQFPPINTVVRHPRDAPSVKVTFKQSSTHLIPDALSVYFSIGVIDAEARAITVDVCGHMSGSAPLPLENRMPFYSGIYDQSRFHASLENVLYTVVDHIQAKEPKRSSWLALESSVEQEQ